MYFGSHLFLGFLIITFINASLICLFLKSKLKKGKVVLNAIVLKLQQKKKKLWNRLHREKKKNWSGDWPLKY